MRVARVQPDPKLVRYELDYRISGKERFQVNSINFYIARSVLDYEDDSSSSHSFFHIFHESEPSDVWNERMDAFALYQEKKYVEAKEKYKALSVRSVERNFDLEMLAASANAAGDYPSETHQRGKRNRRSSSSVYKVSFLDVARVADQVDDFICDLFRCCPCRLDHNRILGDL
jgi:hypothetical protein